MYLFGLPLYAEVPVVLRLPTHNRCPVAATAASLDRKIVIYCWKAFCRWWAHYRLLLQISEEEHIVKSYWIYIDNDEEDEENKENEE